MAESINSGSPSDHDLLIALNQTVAGIRDNVREIRTETLENGKRLETITLRQSQQDSRMDSMGRDIDDLKKLDARDTTQRNQQFVGMHDQIALLKEEHRRDISSLKEKVELRIEALEDNFKERLVQIRTLMWVATPFYGLVIVVTYEFIKRWLLP